MLVYFDDTGMVLVRRNGLNQNLQSLEYTSVYPEGKGIPGNPGERAERWTGTEAIQELQENWKKIRLAFAHSGFFATSKRNETRCPHHNPAASFWRCSPAATIRVLSGNGLCKAARTPSPCWTTARLRCLAGRRSNFAGIHRAGTSSGRSRVNGQILAEPAIQENRLFTATENGTVYALDANSGRSCGRNGKWKATGSPRRSPSSDDVLLAPSSNGTLYALSSQNGRLLWSVPGNKKYSAARNRRGFANLHRRICTGLPLRK